MTCHPNSGVLLITWVEKMRREGMVRVVRGTGQGREQGNEQVTGIGGWQFALLCSWSCAKGKGGAQG